MTQALSQTVRSLDGNGFAQALHAGTLAVVRECDNLDRINVFPVADADTGANLAATLRAASARLGAGAPSRIGDAARLAADAALDGARGNSGAIFAQFLRGLAESFSDRAPRGHARVRRRRRAGLAGRLERPAEPARGHHPLGAAGLVARALGGQRAHRGLRATPWATPCRPPATRSPRRRASSPCWPATGWSTPAARASSTFSRACSTGCAPARRGGRRLRRRPPRRSSSPAPTTRSTPPIASAPRRSCRASAIDTERVKARVAPLGDSLVVAGGGSRVRIHLHTNAPLRVPDRGRRASGRSRPARSTT